MDKYLKTFAVEEMRRNSTFNKFINIVCSHLTFEQKKLLKQ